MSHRFTPALQRTASRPSSDDVAMTAGSRAAALPPTAARAVEPGDRSLRVRDRESGRPVVKDSARGATRAERDRGADVWPLAAAKAMRDADPSAELTLLLDRLREHVAVLVRIGRAEGLPIQQVLPQVKGLVREAESCERWNDPADIIMAHVVRWTTEIYYEHEEAR